MLGTDEPFKSLGYIKIIEYIYLMRITGISIKGPSGGDLINCVHLWTLKSIDNESYSLKGTKKVLLGM